MEREKYMKRAMELAKLGEGYVNPNPLVGCVIVKDGKIISEGYHERYGEYHAERNALLKCDNARGADLYVNLEPCCHQGKTPPCTDIIIEKGIKRVYIAALDPNLSVNGKGIQILRDYGIEVHTGILEKEARKLNEVFYNYMENKKTYIAMKYAMTLDGKIACKTGDSRWVSGSKSREYVQRLRRKYSAIMVGIGTVLEDNPMLNCRISENVDPIRIVCDSSLRIPIESNIVTTADKIKTIVAYCNETADKEAMLRERGVILLKTEKRGDHIDIRDLMRKIYELNIDSVLLEGGGTLNESFIREKLVDKAYIYVAPKIVGGVESKTPVEGKGVNYMSDALVFHNMEVKKIGEDILIEAYGGGETCLQE